MNKAKRNNISVALGTLALFALPAFAFAQSQPTTLGVPQGATGIFSCNQNGADAMSVGALGATGGVYVPVADATVELNTGTLVYKECILREVVDAERIAATAAFAQQEQTQIQSGRNGSPEYVVNPLKDELTADNQIVVDDLQNNGTLDYLDPNIKSSVQQAIAQGYVVATQNAGSMLTCPYQGATADFTTANPQGSIWNDVLAIGSVCNPLFAYIDANNAVNSDIAAGNSVLEQEWQEGGGLYPVTTGGINPLTQQIVTPATLVNSSATQIIESPFNQLQNANDLGQMVGALFAGISTQITSPNGGGLAGLSQPIGNQPSYLAQAVTQTTQNLQSTISNAALANLQAALQLEQTYFSTMTSIGNTLAGAVSQLRGAEGQCWQQIIQKVCTSAPSANGTCQDSDGDTLQVATSTEFSAAVINAQIAPLAQTTQNNLKISQQALTVINGLIRGVQNTSSADAQSVAIEQLNSLITNRQLHTQADISAAQQQQSSVQTFIGSSTGGGLLQTAINNWTGTDSNGTPTISWNGVLPANGTDAGWCNFEDPTTIQLWEKLWKK